MSVKTSFYNRVEDASRILSVKTKLFIDLLNESGLDNSEVGLSMLDSSEVSVEDLVSIIVKDSDSESKDYPLGKKIMYIPAKVAAGVLKGNSNKGVEENNDTLSKDKVSIAHSLRPIHQWNDKSLLEEYVSTRGMEVEEELDRRAKHQKFVVLKDPEDLNLKRYEPGKEIIDVDYSLELLKRVRKGKINSSIVPYKEKMANVFRVTELNIEERKVELCPVCGETLFKGYCDKCELNWTTVDKYSRAYVRLVSEYSKSFKKESFSDRRALYASSLKGTEDLKKTWPSICIIFDERKEVDDLPRLVLIENRPSTQVQDPFHTQK